MANSLYSKRALDLNGKAFAGLIASADCFICAAGFEARTRRIPMCVKSPLKNPIVVAFENGPPENEQTFQLFLSKFEKRPGFDVSELDWAHLERFEISFEQALRRLKNLETCNIVPDISGFPNFAICVAIAQVRLVYPMANLTLLHTEADIYYPTHADFARIKKLSKNRSNSAPEFLTSRAVTLFMPSLFSGVTLGHNDTCLIVFPGYEPHRTLCVIEATNPSKLVMVYGEPERQDLKWRLELSRIMHKKIDDQIMRTEEVSNASDVSSNLELLLQYYDFLYDDHVLCVSPSNSKMQAVASVLAWETYPDIQLAFPIPAEFLAKRFSKGFRDSFVIPLGAAPAARRFYGESAEKRNS